jgi:spermidine synthase
MEDFRNVNSLLRPYPNMGNHLILDFNNVTNVDLDDYELLNKLLREILAFTHVTIIGGCFKKLEPQGVTILYLLSESHFSIHTWPEKKSCTIDFFHCGDKSLNNLKIAEEKLCTTFGWENCTSTSFLKRGCLSSFLVDDFMDKSVILRNVKLLHKEKSDFQEIRVYDTLAMGRILVLDGAIQISSKFLGQNDNYTIDMTRLVLNDEKNYEHVIIIGGGDLVIASFILQKYLNVKKLTVCEIDKRVIENAYKFFQNRDNIQKYIEDGRLEIVIDSGASYMKKLIKVRDETNVGAIIIDCTDFALDESSLAAELFSIEFYENIYQLLTFGSGFSQQISLNIYEDFSNKVVKKGGFLQTEFYKSVTPEYGGSIPIMYGFK